MYGQYLKAARLRTGLSVPELAGRAVISADAIYKLERNANPPELKTLDRLASAMGMLVGDLLPNSGASGQFEAIEAAVAGLSEDEIREQILVLANQARLARNAILRRRPVAAADNVLPFPPIEDRKEMSDDAMLRLEEVMKQAGAEPRKAARGPERDARFFGLASAGVGIEVFDDIPDEYRQIPQWAWKKGARGVFKAAGDSMQDIGIFDHDIMFVLPTPEPPSGAIVIALLNREVYVKVLKRDSQGVPVQLVSKNPNYPAKDISPNDDVQFFGVVVGRTGDL